MSWKITIVKIITIIITKTTIIITTIITKTTKITTIITTITTTTNNISQTRLIETKEFVSSRKKVATKSVLAGFVATFIIIK